MTSTAVSALRPPGRGARLVLLAVLALGLLHLPHPFGWDQSLFTLGAERLAAGGVLYRDFWDVKQPGIYWFYTLAGRLFGFSEPGIHLLELLWMMTFALTLLVTLRRRWGQGPAATLAPLFVVGAYYAGATDYYLTQVEGLVGFPLYLTLWFATGGADEEPRAWRGFLSGLCGAVVLLFKLVFLPLVAAFWLLALVEVARRRGVARALAVVALPVALGLLLPVAAVLALFARLDLLGTLVWTYFTYPAFLLAQIHGGQAARLVDGLQRFLLRFAPLVGLAVVGAGATGGRRDPLGLGLVVWLDRGDPGHPRPALVGVAVPRTAPARAAGCARRGGGRGAVVVPGPPGRAGSRGAGAWPRRDWSPSSPGSSGSPR